MLYKYRGISSRTERIITEGKIWLAGPEALNDPLECQIKPFNPEKMREHLLKVKGFQAAGFVMAAVSARERGRLFFGLRSKEIKHLLNRIKFAKKFDKKYKIMRDFHQSIGANKFSDPEDQLRSIAKQLKEVGIFSLSEDPFSTLMWSHYGESHKGIAIGFNPIEGSNLSNANKCRPVQYSDDLSEFSFEKGFSSSVTFYDDGPPESAISFKDEQIQRAICTKTSAWAYEKEWRYITPKSGEYDLPAPIAEVVFGAKCMSETREKYREMVVKKFGRGVKFREAVFLPGTISLVLKDC
jgi:hypothetical protein